MIRTYDLSGIWDFSMAQMSKGNCPTAFADTISLPGTTSLAKKGTPNPERETGFLTDAYAFEGQAWFQKQVYVDPEYIGKPMRLTLERTRLTQLWMDGKYVGSCDSLCTPHQYDVTEFITKPLVTITICVKNTDYPTKGGHLTSPDTQSNWNGITGDLKLEVFDEVYIDNLQAYPDAESKTVTLKMQLHGAKSAKVQIRGSVLEDDEQDTIPEYMGMLTTDATGEATLTISLGDTVYLWSEYHPNLYFLTILVNDCDVSTVSFGVRKFQARTTDFTINDTPIMLRGKHDGMIFPRTGFAPTDVQGWLDVLTIAKEYGINHYRFHTCCPPDAAFTAADILGIYMEPELPFWGTLTDENDPKHNAEEQAYLIALGDKILDTFGNHPSFVMFSLGNELWGSKERMGEIIRRYKAKDSRHLYTQGCNNFQHFPLMIPEDDYFVGVRLSRDRLLRGSYGMCDAPLGHIQTDAPSADHCYDDIIFPKQEENTSGAGTKEIEIQYGTGVKKVQVSDSANGLIPNRPIVTHEIGQYETYPNFQEIEKYTGPLKARNFEIFRERLEAKGMLDMADKFFRCSGALSAACYKEEIEAVMRSKYIAGFQLLDLQDFSGQGTALVGMLDAFMESKGILSSEEWRRFCDDTVLLGVFPSYVLYGGDTFTAQVKIRNYNPDFTTTPEVQWLLLDETGTTLGEGILQETIAPFGLTEVGEIACDLPIQNQPTFLHLILSVTGTEILNSYDLTLYPPKETPNMEISQEHSCITTDWQEAKEALEKGKNVLFLPKTVAKKIPGFYCTDFWCYPMFRDICNWMKKDVAVGTMGLCIQDMHPALSYFPTQEYSTPGWYEIVSHADCAILDDTPATFRPIVQMADNFERNHKLGLLFEAKVGKGKLLVCTGRLEEIQEKAEANWLLYSLLSYFQSEEFQPQEELTLDILDKIF